MVKYPKGLDKVQRDLLMKLNSELSEQVRSACKTVVDAHDTSFAPNIRARIVETKNPEILKPLVHALGELKDPFSVNVLHNLLATSHPPKITKHIITALGAIGHADSFGHICGKLNHADPTVRAAAVQALVNIKADSGQGFKTIPLAVGSLIAQLPKEKNPTVLVEIISALGQTNSANAIPHLFDIAVGEDEKLAGNALDAIDKMAEHNPYLLTGTLDRIDEGHLANRHKLKSRYQKLLNICQNRFLQDTAAQEVNPDNVPDGLHAFIDSMHELKIARFGKLREMKAEGKGAERFDNKSRAKEEKILRMDQRTDAKRINKGKRGETIKRLQGKKR